MDGDFSVMGRLRLAMAVIARWETLVTLGAFVAFWLLLRYIADPWRRDERKPRGAPIRKAKKSSPPPADDAGEADEPDDGEFPD
ncbi:MAG TPA: hypothetical protein P5298_01070 [Spirochaetia bacterium]|nr:hypothetical protein [Spirochaetaceae bacterium]HPE88090.1 hypothetical protein [Spirochaetales bacterium]HRW22985.1 hypothetical protein [Spirochaetia bacterium]